MGRYILLTILLQIALPVLAQQQPQVFSNQIIVSPRGLDSVPIGNAIQRERATSVDDNLLRDISIAAGIYEPQKVSIVCLPGQVNCKPSAGSPEKINLERVSTYGDVSEVIQVADAVADKYNDVLAAVNAVASLEGTPNYWRTTTQANEPAYNLQWGFFDPSTAAGGAAFHSAWRRQLGAPSVTVAIIDTGVVRTHRELSAALVPGLDTVSAVAFSGDGDSIDLDPNDPGDYVTPSEAALYQRYGVACASPKPSSWHGSHVAGTVAAAVNGLFGTGGAPGVRILPVRVLGKCGGQDIDILRGIAWAMGVRIAGLPANAHPAHILNLSLGGSSLCTPHYRQLFAEARRRGIVVVVAAGNDGRNTISYTPAGCPDVFPVAAHDRSGLKANFSNFGSNVVVSAPGVGVYSSVDSGSSVPVSDFAAEANGTSMAAPHVAAAVALVKSGRPSATVDEIRTWLFASARPFLSGSGCALGEAYSGLCGRGYLDANALLTASGMSQPTTPPPPATSDDSSGGGCFIATAAYGSPLADEVMLLRRFRDQILSRSEMGRRLISVYYTYSPPAANWIAHSEVRRTVARAVIYPAVVLVKHPSLLVPALLLWGVLCVRSFWYRRPPGRT